MDCIAAIATPHGTGGVAIVRLSGDGALCVAQKMFTPAAKTVRFVPNRMYAGKILGDGFTDFGFMVYFASPKSFTGEDVVEFHCHGGAVISNGILKKALMLGARSAERGEFTRRAFLNGKLSLASAEGMADMINAESLALVRAGEMMYNEKLTSEVRQIQGELTDILAGIAAELDYPEEDVSGIDYAKIKQKLLRVSARINALTQSYSCGKKIKSGVSVAICGSPNVGKSSLLNALLGYEKAIVSPEAGTTRDGVEGSLQIDGIVYNFTDTAGIRQGAGEIEKMGIARAERAVRTADIVLFVTDGTGTPPVNFSGKLIKVFNKCDINKPNGEYDAVISAVTGEGLQNLKQILSRAAVGEQTLQTAYIVEERHYFALVRADGALKQAAEKLDELTPDLMAVDIRECWDILGEITGDCATEEIINAVFAKFCVGK